MTSDDASKSPTRFLPAIGRVLMGLAFTFFGSNGLFHYLPDPKMELPDKAMSFIMALVNSGYMMPMICGTQLIVGLMLLTNRFVPLALALIAPFIVNSVAFHLFLEPGGRVMSLIVLAFELALAWAYRGSFKPMLAMKAKPGP